MSLRPHDPWGPLGPIGPRRYDAIAALPVGDLARIIRRHWDPLYWLERDEPELFAMYELDRARCGGEDDDDVAGVARQLADASAYDLDLYDDEADETDTPLARLAREIARRETPQNRRIVDGPDAATLLKGLPLW